MQLRGERQRNTKSPRENISAPLTAAFMLPIMRDYDKRADGVDFLESGFTVLGEILYTLGVCRECNRAQPETLILGASPAGIATVWGCANLYLQERRSGGQHCMQHQGSLLSFTPLE